jgi:hypothetical protein
VHSLENPIIMFREQIFLHLQSFFRQLILRKKMSSVQVEFDIENILRSSVTQIQMIGLGIAGIIGE